MSDWNPDSYLKFSNERTQPSIDLVSRIKCTDVHSIMDIGCGPGNSTQVLVNRWPDARVLGIDSSEEMIKKAKKDYPLQNWKITDASRLDKSTKYDIVFSNATLQWLHNHETLIPDLFALVNKDGALAVQVPRNVQSPLHQSLMALSSEKPWSQYMKNCRNIFNYQSIEYYYKILLTLSSKIDLWGTTYYHILQSQQNLIDWYRSTAMRPFLDCLPNEIMKKQFEANLLEKCKDMYPVQENGCVLYPFERTFFVAYN